MTKKEREILDWAFEQTLRDVVGGYISTNRTVVEARTWVNIDKIGTYDIVITKRR